MIARLVWFIIGLALVLGAMTRTAHFAHAMNITPYCLQHQGAKICEAPLWIYRPIPPPSPARAQINRCITYGIDHGRGVQTTDVKDPNTKRQAENQDDWLYFCMQQARWQFVETCNNDVPKKGDMGENYYREECWAWTKPKPRSLPCTWGSCSGPPTDRWTKEH